MRKVIAIVVITHALIACEDFVKIDPPRTDLIEETVFTSDATVSAAINAIYQKLVAPNSIADGGKYSISFLAGLSSDEILNYNSIGAGDLSQFNDNKLTATNGLIASLWSNSYQYIYSSNALLEGLTTSHGVTDSMKDLAEGEAKFIRAFVYFYLVNLFGSVPLVLTTDYQVNTTVKRIAVDEVYAQIINDLSDAQNLLADGYISYGNQRVRASKAAASALLARVYLYLGDWINAEIQATSVIENTALYDLTTLNTVFLTNSKEAIWQLGKSAGVATDVVTFNYNPYRSSAFSQQLTDSFEDGDSRKSIWHTSATVGGITYHYACKYKGLAVPPVEYTTMLRLSEQYLIRAEARVQLSDVVGAQIDLNVIRNRAGLEDTPAVDKTSLLVAIEQERRVELFTEWGHRWLDLKRTGRADDVLGSLKTGWESYAKLYPIPNIQILNDPALRNAQNPGYD